MKKVKVLQERLEEATKTFSKCNRTLREQPETSWGPTDILRRNKFQSSLVL